jgi:hypothetical protein
MAAIPKKGFYAGMKSGMKSGMKTGMHKGKDRDKEEKMCPDCGKPVNKCGCKGY